MISSSYSLGLLFIVLVALIWAASSVLVQYLYSDAIAFDSPFLLTYIGVSLFTLWLPTHCLTEWIGDWCCREKSTLSSSSPASSSSSPAVEMGQRAVAYQSLATAADEDPEEPPQPQQLMSASAVDEDDDSSLVSLQHSVVQRHWTHADHRAAARLIAPVWFLANWTYNASLAYTSITSSTVLASTGSLFTFMFAVCWGDEGFGWLKLGGVVLGVLGSSLTAWHDRDRSTSSSSVCEPDCSTTTSPDQALLGDLLGLLSAVGYGTYAVQTRLLCPHKEELYSMQLLLGYIGLFNCVALSPIALFSYHSSGLSWLVFGFLVVKGLLDNVLSDYLWLRAVILTNATVATVGLGLTIPLALLSDLVLVKQQTESVWSLGSVGGAVAVMAGFVLVNVGNQDDDSSTRALVSQSVESAADGYDDEPSPQPFSDRRVDEEESEAETAAVLGHTQLTVSDSHDVSVAPMTVD